MLAHLDGTVDDVEDLAVHPRAHFRSAGETSTARPALAGPVLDDVVGVVHPVHGVAPPAPPAPPAARLALGLRALRGSLACSARGLGVITRRGMDEFVEFFANRDGDEKGPRGG